MGTVATPATSDGSRIRSGFEPSFDEPQARTKNSGGVISSLLRTVLSTWPRL